MSEKGIDITTPVGRIVWGHPSKSVIKKYQDGANKGQVVLRDGQPVQQWAFGLAIDKNSFQRDVWPAMAQEAATGYPSGIPSRFAWKYQDGDGPDNKGIPFSKREGYGGCYVLTISTEYQAAPIFKLENGAYRQCDPKELKAGDFVAVGINIKVNVATGTNTPSLYINPRGIELVGYGSEIVSQAAADPNALFGGQQRALPPGASAIPQHQPNAPGLPIGGQMQGPGPGQTAPYMPPAPMAPQPGYPPMQPPPQPGYGAPGYPPPAHDFVAQAGYPRPQPGYPPPGAPMAPQPGYPPMQPPPSQPGYGAPPAPGYAMPGYPPAPR